MGVVSQYSMFHDAQNASSAWRLLRARNAPLILAILDTHFNDETRQLPAAELASMVELDLQDLRFRTNIEYDRTGVEACEQWRKDGYLARQTAKQRREESYELTSGTQAALAFAKQLIQPRHAATQSRLSLIMDAVRTLATASSTDIDRRREALLAQRAILDEQLAQIENGTFTVVEGEDGLEQLSDIIALVNEIPLDFTRVKDDFLSLSKDLFATIVGYGENHQDILNDIFAGIDHIGQSSAGRSFRGFYELLRDNDLMESFQDDINAILETDFAEALTSQERRQLHGVVRNFLAQSGDVNDALLSLSHGLQRFVQSQRYQTERQIKKDIDRALLGIHELLTSPQGSHFKFELSLTSLSMKPIARWRLCNPAENQTEPLLEIETCAASPLTLNELLEEARETEIDLEELVANVNATLRALPQTPYQPISVGDVLKNHPATQGAASVIGLIGLAFDQGRETAETEQVHWETEDGRWKHSTIARFEFYREVVS
ncbi:DUF3375 domain-containing protein [Adlercreutzia mucosicola]|nr:DUF3375 domain-containing protein [Adlercreutzia mucosicola]MCR2035436.1 DUF3375 domain-containing protein [Adlercreutzia mucosicola]